MSHDNDSWSKHKIKITSDLKRIEKTQQDTLEDIGELKIMLAEMRTEFRGYGKMSERLRVVETSQAKLKVKAGLIGTGGGGAVVLGERLLSMLFGV